MERSPALTAKNKKTAAKHVKKQSSGGISLLNNLKEKAMSDKIKASCTWGDGPDILLIFNDKPFICYENPILGQWKHGHVTKGAADLTQQEARDLAASLISAADACKALEDSYEDYVANGGETKMKSFKIRIPEKE
jgi:hypothetical protein